MSHLFSFRNASLRALRSSSKYPIYISQFCQHQEPYSYSTLSSSPPNRIPSTETNNTKSTKHTLSEQALPLDSSQGSVYTLVRHFHTSPIVRDTVNVTTPTFPESVKDGTIRLLKKVGDQVSADETIAEIETDKTNLSVNTPQAGVIEAFSVADGDTVTAGVQIAKLNTSADAKPSSDDKSTTKIDTEKVKDDSSKPPEPSSQKPSTQPTPTKVEVPKSDTPVAKPPVSGLDPNKISGTRSETRVKMSRMRLKIAQRLKEAQNTCAMLTTFNEIDMSNIVEFRKKFADQFAKRHNLKLGFMSAFVKASACALVDNPIVNAVIDGGEIVYRDYVDISVAVASPKGLVVPVLRNVEKMNFADIERAIGEFGEKAKKGSLSIEDMDGGTFTISNGGVFGSLFGTPIINPPQTAILGMHGIFDRPVVVNGKMEIRPMMYVALTYDHRLLDGRDATLFLRRIKQYVEDCRTIFLEL